VAKSKRAFLREELSRRFISYLRSSGFEQDQDLSKANGRSTFPFGALIRKRGTSSDIIEIQFDKYKRPKFIVNFRRDPPKLFKERPFASGTGTVKETEAFRLHPRPKSSGWFTMRTFFGLRSPEVSAKKVVDRLVSVFPEVESWFKDGIVGEHLRGYPLLVFIKDENE
jgi:hypothetical protein